MLLRLIASGGSCPADTSEHLLVEVLPIEATFTHTVSGPLTVGFSAQTNGATSWQWDFGDGAASQGANPTHVFPAGGTYQVCLIASNVAGCQDTSCQDVAVGSVAITGTEVSLAVYPNPVRDQLYVSWSDGPMQLSLIDVQGQEVLHRTGYQTPTRLSVHALPAGMYWLRASLGETEVWQVLVKQ